MNICFDAKRLTSCKYQSDRALGIIFFTGWTITYYFKYLCLPVRGI